MGVGALVSIMAVAIVKILALLGLVVASLGASLRTSIILRPTIMRLAVVATLAGSAATTTALVSTAATTAIRTIILAGLECPSSTMLLIGRRIAAIVASLGRSGLAHALCLGLDIERDGLKYD